MHLPGPLRAAVGFVASAADEAKRLPDRALELPMLAVSTALQASVRAQQRYARLTARGDEVLNRTRPTDEPPEWAQFDAPVPVEDLAARRPAAADQVARNAPAKKAPTKKAAAEQTPAKKAAVKKAPAKKAPAKRSAAAKTPAEKAPAAPPAVDSGPPEQLPADNVPAEPPTSTDAPTDASSNASSNGKSISKPRHTAPSRFDDVTDD